jgi:hypothetical protein
VGAGSEQPIKQQHPNFARPRKRLFRHQLEGAISGNFLRSDIVELQRLLIDIDKNEILARWRLTAFTPEQIFERLLATLDKGEEMHVRETVGGDEKAHDEHSPECADNGEGKQTMARNPIHSGILENQRRAANLNVAAATGVTENAA